MVALVVAWVISGCGVDGVVVVIVLVLKVVIGVVVVVVMRGVAVVMMGVLAWCGGISHHQHHHRVGEHFLRIGFMVFKTTIALNNLLPSLSY